MKSSARMAAAWLMLSILLAACGQTTPRAPLSVLVGTSASYPPFESVDSNQRALVGFDIDLMRAIAVKSALRVEFVNTAYEPLLAAVTNCTYDAAIAAIPVDDKLRSAITFSNPYLSVGK